MKRTMKKLTAFMLALLLFAGQLSTAAFAATSEGVSLDVAPYAVEGSADRLDFDPYSDYIENEIYVTDEYLQPTSCASTSALSWKKAMRCMATGSILRNAPMPSARPTVRAISLAGSPRLCPRSTKARFSPFPLKG